MRQASLGQIFVTLTAILCFSPLIVDAKSPAAQERFKDIYLNQLACLDESRKSRACSGLEGAYDAAGFGDLQEDASGGGEPPPHEWPSVDWDDFSVPSPAVTLENSSVGATFIQRFSVTEHDLTTHTGTLRNFNIRHEELPNGSQISQVGTIGDSQLLYQRSSSLGTSRNDFFELQYDNAPGSGSIGGAPFDITRSGEFDTMVLHFNKVAASTRYVAGDVELEGSRVCVFAYGPSGPFEAALSIYRPDSGNGCSGTVIESGNNIELVITYTEYFRRLSGGFEYYCELVEIGEMSPELFFAYFGITYEQSCLSEMNLSMFTELQALVFYVDGADEITIDKITLQKRQ